jgi:hypothetical protein
MFSPISNLNLKSHRKDIFAMIDGRYKVWCDAINIFNSTTNDGCEAEVWIKTREDSLPHTSGLSGKTFAEIGSDSRWNILDVRDNVDPENSPRVILCLTRLEDDVHASDE